jgi:hypothetical protein
MALVALVVLELQLVLVALVVQLRQWHRLGPAVLVDPVGQLFLFQQVLVALVVRCLQRVPVDPVGQLYLFQQVLEVLVVL